MDVYHKALRNPNPPKKSEAKPKPKLPIPDIQQQTQQQQQQLSEIYSAQHSAYTTRPPPILMESTEKPPTSSSEPKELSSSSSSRKKKNSRRKHRNSHLGCGTCKRRRIKCDETLPACLNCLKGKLHCAYLNLDSNARNALRMAQYNQNMRQEKLSDAAFKKEEATAVAAANATANTVNAQGIPTIIHAPPQHVQLVQPYAPGQPTTNLSPQYVTQAIHQPMTTGAAPGATPLATTATTVPAPTVVQSPYGPLVAVLTNTGSVVYAPTSTLSQPLQILTTLPTANPLEQGMMQIQQVQQNQVQQQIQQQQQQQAQQQQQQQIQQQQIQQQQLQQQQQQQQQQIQQQQHQPQQTIQQPQQISPSVQQQVQQAIQPPQPQQPSSIPITSSAASVAVKASQSIPIKSDEISLPPITNTTNMSATSSSEFKLPPVKSTSYSDVKSLSSSSSPNKSPILPSLSQQFGEASVHKKEENTVVLPSISTLQKASGTTPPEEEKVSISKLIS
ncbi:uncharacterized protein SPAPADRAFT_62580 [Spathaspora passalidarum NRRL Y-27907]|uniref:Zn(2)-C6 fungal-type domain-containing protein n=1 Tax=Spathaspora passalidarum (strain NRRL Y-27907 / 11-Y1) TaxID=619300 RepID=G3ASN3_SPAPN|nr:uncharacterized protein SPAPADRAFT_62580 [Spathaspora passalidarum NRRL Y-27907]EGW30719.1 hypothetical protein SPAPADRAFT_62580 [Spathaspora passalidarum NRRL Y-27907]